MVFDYIRDHFREKFTKTFIPPAKNDLNIRAIVQQSGESINYHNHINLGI